MSTPKIHLYSLSELKTTLDDHLPIYLSSSSTPSGQPLPRKQRFTPSYIITYIRLALGYSAVAIALYIFYLDYVLKIKFQEIKGTTTLAVIGYFILNGALTLWQWFGEKGLVFAGSRSEGSSTLSLKLHSHPSHRKYDPSYRLTVDWSVDGKPEKTGSAEVKAPFTKFFSSDSQFVPGSFETWLRQSVPVTVAPINNISTTLKGLSQDDDSVIDTTEKDGGLSSSAATVSSIDETLTPSPKKRGRPRKSETPKPK